MESSRQESFKKLRAPCVELSSTGLKFRSQQATSNDVLRALEPVHNVLKELADNDALDEKLAEYAFFPLTNIFNETQRVSARCLEVAVNGLTILVAKGWRQRLSPQMGKQLIILMTLIVGGVSGQNKEDRTGKTQPEELTIAGFNCLSTIIKALQGPVAERTIFHEIGTATIVDQTVYLLLEGILDDRSDEICLAAATALQTLYMRVTDRVVLASIMPRTVSALTKVLKPTTQARRSYRLLEICLKVLNRMLRTVLGDQVATSIPQKSTEPPQASERPVLDESWLKATATQIKLALANVIQVRRHERPEVQAALLGLCLMVIEYCPITLKDSLPMMVETVVVLSELDETQTPNNAYSTLKHLATTYPVIVDSLKDSLHNWITSFPRTMQSNDETAKQWGIKQISTTFQILSQVQSGSDILTAGLASGLCDSVAAAVSTAGNTLQPLSSDGSQNLDLEVLKDKTRSASFPPVLLEHRSQQQTLRDLRSMIVRLNLSDSGAEITRSVINRMHHASGDSIIGSFWLALNFLTTNTQLSTSFDDFISFDQVEPSLSASTRASMIEELYYVSLPILNEASTDSQDWRVTALALEAVALQAQQLGEAFRPELMDALYPTLQLLASSNPSIQKHAMICLNILTAACNYTDTSAMIIGNVDYLTNSVALKLNTFDVSPYPPQVLLMMVKLCGARLIPYLDDLVDSIFGIVDMYHGYPKLVEMMFKTLAAIVEEGTKKPSLLAITSGQGSDVVNHRKRPYQRLLISTLAEDFAARKAKRARFPEEELEDAAEGCSHPKRPWAEEPGQQKQPERDEESLSDILEKGESDEPLPPPREPDDAEKPLSKSHNLLLHIIKSIPSHLSSPSPYLRRSLLSILIQVIPVLSQNENSFLPLINDLWPSVAARVAFPSSMQNESSSTALLMKDASTDLPTRTLQKADGTDFQEETFVIVAACHAIQAMCKGAGDFMASRVEAEFPHWERLYRRAWDKVRQDAEKAIERRANHQAKSSRSELHGNGLDLLLGLSLSHSSALTKAGAPAGARAFTPHHSLWRALTSLFLTLLVHVRLPLSVGDQICEFLGAWIVRYAGPEFYSLRCRRSELGETDSAAGLSDSIQAEVKAVDDAIQAMETWNADLTWFIFQQQRARVLEIVDQGRPTPTPMPMPKISEVDVPCLNSLGPFGGKLKFAEVVF